MSRYHDNLEEALDLILEAIRHAPDGAPDEDLRELASELESLLYTGLPRAEVERHRRLYEATKFYGVASVGGIPSEADMKGEHKV